MAPRTPPPLARRAGRLAATGLALACGAAAAQDTLPRGRVDLQLMLEPSRGDYGEPAATHILQTSLLARLRGAGWVAEVQWPWLSVRSAGAAGGLPDAARSGRSTEQGPGDLWLKLVLELRPFESGRTGVDLSLKLKAPTGDASRGLGSGGTDLAAQLELVRGIGPWALFGHLGWRRTGDVAGFAPYRDPWYGEAGLSRSIAPAWEIGGFVDVREPIGRLGALGETTAYAAWRDGGQRVQVHLTRGFAAASPDWAAGLSWRTRF